MNATSKMTIRATATRTVEMLRVTMTFSSLPLVCTPGRAHHKGTMPARESDAAVRQPLPHCFFKQKYVTVHGSTQLFSSDSDRKGAFGRQTLPYPAFHRRSEPRHDRAGVRQLGRGGDRQSGTWRSRARQSERIRGC